LSLSGRFSASRRVLFERFHCITKRNLHILLLLKAGYGPDAAFAQVQVLGTNLASLCDQENTYLAAKLNSIRERSAPNSYLVLQGSLRGGALRYRDPAPVSVLLQLGLCNANIPCA
jgi:hypothetical protein